MTSLAGRETLPHMMSSTKATTMPSEMRRKRIEWRARMGYCSLTQ